MKSQSSKELLAAMPESAWTPFDVTDDYIRSYTYIDIGGEQVRAERTQYLADALLQKANIEEQKHNEGTRWGDGKVVARIPLNVWYKELRDKVKEGDRDHMSWFLNREENAAFRTRKGKV